MIYLLETDMTNQTTETTTTETQDSTDTPQVKVEPLTQEQEINALRNVHTFLSSYDRVPGALANQWAQVLDAVALVANSLISKLPKNTTETTETTETTLTQ